MKPDLRVLPDVAEMSLRAAEATVATINDAVRVAGAVFARAGRRQYAANALRSVGVAVSSAGSVGTGACLLGG